jgi:hypothetical protein
MFNLSEWLKDNLITSCRERSFTVAQINLMAYNYFNNTKLTEEDFNAVTVVAAEVQAEIDAAAVVVEEPVVE